MDKANVFMKDDKVLVSEVRASLNLRESVETALNLVGDVRKVISSGDKVFVKPNFNSDDPFPASSDPEFVKTVVHLLYDAGASEVTIIESSGMNWLPTKNVLEKTGMLRAAEECRAQVRILDHGEWVEKTIEGKRWKKISIAREALDEDAKFVWLPCMKTHRHASFSLSLKLVVGLLDFRWRGDLHSGHLEEKIAEINLAVHPDLIVMDGRKCFVSGGPDVGRMESPGVILASGDRIATDVEAIKIIQTFQGSSLQADPWSYIQIRRAGELGLGVTSEQDYRVVKPRSS